MSPSAPTPTVTSPASAVSEGSDLRNLYAVRCAFALVWAALLAASAASLNPLSVTLLVLYPLFDLGAAVYDFRSPSNSRARGALAINMALSTVAAIGLAVAAGSEIPDVLRVWGAWAITAGLVQLVVAVRRRHLGGQWPLILSGGISVLAGASFWSMASGDDPAITALAGYAALGGTFFALAAFRLRRVLV
ncbi:MAG: hypothetical protein JWQ74_1095 [Marmoricola sp.]|nr:hypothetical protein [Marmoricola sp.]